MLCTIRVEFVFFSRSVLWIRLQICDTDVPSCRLNLCWNYFISKFNWIIIFIVELLSHLNIFIHEDLICYYFDPCPRTSPRINSVSILGARIGDAFRAYLTDAVVVVMAAGVKPSRSSQRHNRPSASPPSSEAVQRRRTRALPQNNTFTHSDMF
jgi:hypothetical protein